MKITAKDLDPTLLEKINQFDYIKADYDINSPDCYISYNGLNFYMKKTNDNYMRKVYTEDEINDLKDNLYTTKYSSTFNENLLLDNKTNAACKLAMHEVNLQEVYNAVDTLVFSKVFANQIVLYTCVGTVIVLSNNIKKYSVDLITLLNDNFNTHLDVYDLNDIELIEDGFLVALENAPVYKYSEKTNSLEVLINVQSVKKLSVISEDKIFCANQDECGIYRLDSGMKTETYLNLKKVMQAPYLLENLNGNIALVGKPLGLYSSDNLLHYWAKDAAGLSLNNKDGQVSRNLADNDYYIKDLAVFKDNIYISGTYKNQIFVWKYDKNNLHKKLREEVLTCYDFSQYKKFLVIGENTYLVAIKNRVFIIENNKIIENYNVPFGNEISNMFLADGGFYMILNSHLMQFSLPTYSKTNAVLSFKVFDEDTSCNNIDILISGATKANVVTLVDVETNTEITPSYYMIYKDTAIIKLINCKATEILLKLTVFTDSNINGIVVKKNRVFLR